MVPLKKSIKVCYSKAQVFAGPGSLKNRLHNAFRFQCSGWTAFCPNLRFSGETPSLALVRSRSWVTFLGTVLVPTVTQ